MALLGGVAAIGIAKSVSAQTPAVPLSPGGGNGGEAAAEAPATVTSISALAALSPTTGGSVLLTQSGRFGQFNWTTGNYGTQITNDPGQGVWVALGADSAPEVTGAWSRVYSGAVNLGC
jgi:hypothetical protein